jgi:hypothetical protein
MIAFRGRIFVLTATTARDTYPPPVANGRNLFRPLSAGDLADFKFAETGTVRTVPVRPVLRMYLGTGRQ